jgi:DNA-directed RNA polymerase subunit RPC12/RpoP
MEQEVTIVTSSQGTHYVAQHQASPNGESNAQNQPQQRKSLAMCFTSTGAALSLPPKKKDIYRPYSLDDRPANGSVQSPPPRSYELRIPAEEDLHAAHAILDLSASTAFLPPPTQSPGSSSNHHHHQQVNGNNNSENHVQKSNGNITIILSKSDDRSESHASSSSNGVKTSEAIQNENDNNSSVNIKNNNNSSRMGSSRTVAYTYEAFFVSDGRSKRKVSGGSSGSELSAVILPNDNKAKYTCTECGKQYATSSNLSRHKQTHRSLDSQSAKKCQVCGKAYVSMPALAMHVSKIKQIFFFMLSSK